MPRVISGLPHSRVKTTWLMRVKWMKKPSQQAGCRTTTARVRADAGARRCRRLPGVRRGAGDSRLRGVPHGQSDEDRDEHAQPAEADERTAPAGGVEQCGERHRGDELADVAEPAGELA
jgi:hypothetical protein